MVKYYKEKNRYQYQSWYVKLYRWLKHRPASLMVTGIKVLCLCLTYKQKQYVFPNGYTMNKGFFRQAKSIWTNEKSIAEYHMGYYYTTEELIEKWNNRNLAGAVMDTSQE